MGSWVEDQWVWNLRFRRDLFVWELNLLGNLLEILNGSPISIAVNSWCWKHDSCGFFLVKSAYMVLRQSTADEDRLPTRHNLWKQGVITDVGASMCDLCGLGYESVDHLFGSCNQISPIWYVILMWLGVEWVSPRGILGCFEIFMGMDTFSAECLVDMVKLSS
ncbi:ribonuclease H [Trifolium medium]|uniref:Ribonuclease H n=1 Tax=Trifolium medium TaxID=97028 RepID=A0A392MJU2_9FABA|nr:ribonuclease H [Trifolium medium]